MQRVYIVLEDGTTEGPFDNDKGELRARISELREQPGLVRMELVAADLVCDFCSDVPILWRYSISPGGEFGTMVFIEAGRTSAESHGDRDGQWAACQTCKDFIQTGNWDGLRRHSAERLAEIQKENFGSAMLLSMLEAMVQQAHSVFRAGWNGSEPVREATDAEFASEYGIDLDSRENG